MPRVQRLVRALVEIHGLGDRKRQVLGDRQRGEKRAVLERHSVVALDLAKLGGLHGGDVAAFHLHRA